MQKVRGDTFVWVSFSVLAITGCPAEAVTCPDELDGVELLSDTPIEHGQVARLGGDAYVASTHGGTDLTITRIRDGVVDATSDPAISLADSPLTDAPGVFVWGDQVFVSVSTTVETYGALLAEMPLDDTLQLADEGAWSSRFPTDSAALGTSFCRPWLATGSNHLLAELNYADDSCWEGGASNQVASVAISEEGGFSTYVDLDLPGSFGSAPRGPITTDGASIGWSSFTDYGVYAAIVSIDMQSAFADDVVSLSSVTAGAIAPRGDNTWYVAAAVSESTGTSRIRTDLFEPGDYATDGEEIAEVEGTPTGMHLTGGDDGAVAAWTTGVGVNLLRIDRDAVLMGCVAHTPSSGEDEILSVSWEDGVIEALWTNAEGLWRWAGASW